MVKNIASVPKFARQFLLLEGNKKTAEVPAVFILSIGD